MPKCFFQNSWISNPNFTWLNEVSNDKCSAYCALCDVKFSLSNMGLRAVKSHQGGKKHQLREKSALFSKSMKSTFSKSVPTDQPSSENTPMDVDGNLENNGHFLQDPTTNLKIELQRSVSVQGSQFPQTKGIQKYLSKDNVTKAEIMWCLEAVMTHKSLRSAEKDGKLFPLMFPDSEIAKNMNLGRDKMAYTIIFGISSFFKNNLIEELLSCKHYVIGFDESINKVAQKQQMDVNIRYWSSKNCVKTSYFTSVFLGRTRSTDLLAAFNVATQPLDLKRLLQISMDGPNVNIRFFKELKDFIKTVPEDPEILNIGSCGLHAVNVAFKTGAVSTGWNILQFLRALHYLFKDSPARRALYTQHTSSALFPSKFCSIRWLENAKSVERALSIIPSLRLFISGLEKDKNEPTSKSYKTIKIALEDKLLVAKLSFFLFIAKEMESFLETYQTDNPLIPFLYSDLLNTMMQLMEHIISKEALKKQNIMEVDLRDKEIYLPLKQINLGISTQCYIKKAQVSQAELTTFRNECKDFITNTVIKLKERSPLAYELTRAASCFDPRVALNQKLFSKRLDSLLLILCQKNWIAATAADQAQMQLKKACCQPHTIFKLESYKRSEKIDAFWFNLLSLEENCEQALNVIKIVMLLSHGNANVERGFSINKDCLWDNMKEDSLVARRLIFDTVIAKGGIEHLEISKDMVLHARNARVRFSEASENRRKEDREKAMACRKKRELELAAKELCAKKVKIIKEMNEKIKDIDNEIEALKNA